MQRLRRGEVEVAGLVLIRQKPGSAKGVMSITLEDETEIANLIVWPTLFERQRTLVLRAGLMGCRGRVQHQGGVVHLIAEELSDLSGLLRRIGDVDLERLPTGRGDEARHGGSPDLRDRPTRPPGLPSNGALPGTAPRDIFVRDLSLDALSASGDSGRRSAIRIKARNFR